MALIDDYLAGIQLLRQAVLPGLTHDSVNRLQDDHLRPLTGRVP